MAGEPSGTLLMRRDGRIKAAVDIFYFFVVFLALIKLIPKIWIFIFLLPMLMREIVATR